MKRFWLDTIRDFTELPALALQFIMGWNLLVWKQRPLVKAAQDLFSVSYTHFFEPTPSLMLLDAEQRRHCDSLNCADGILSQFIWIYYTIVSLLESHPCEEHILRQRRVTLRSGFMSDVMSICRAFCQIYGTVLIKVPAHHRFPLLTECAGYKKHNLPQLNKPKARFCFPVHLNKTAPVLSDEKVQTGDAKGAAYHQ